jgi:hypothetical protein
MKDVKFCILWKNKETVLDSIVKDTYTFCFLLLCVYVSKGSNWWTFLTGVMFLLFLFAKTSSWVKEDRKNFHTKEEVRKWLDSIEE